MPEEPKVLVQAYQLYSQGQYRQAYDLLTENQPEYPDWKGRFLEIRMDMAACLGNLDLAESLLESALDEGYFYNDMVLRNDSDVQPLQGRPVYEKLVARSVAALELAQQSARPELKVLEPARNSPQPLPALLGLHGNNSNADEFAVHWSSLVEKGWLVALPQSSQLCARNQYVWNDFSRIDREIPMHYANLQRDHLLDPNKVLVAGFSKGGHVAIHSILRGYVPARGFIGLAPFLGDLSAILPLLGKPGQEKLRCYFVLGEKDPNCTPGSIKLAEMMKSYGIQSEIEIFKDMQHDVPEPFDVVLERATNFILKK